MKKIYLVVAWIHLRSFGCDSLYYKWKKVHTSYTVYMESIRTSGWLRSRTFVRPSSVVVKCPGVVARVLGSILGWGTCRTTSSGQELHSGMLSKRGGPVCPSQPDEKEPCHPKKHTSGCTPVGIRTGFPWWDDWQLETLSRYKIPDSINQLQYSSFYNLFSRMSFAKNILAQSIEPVYLYISLYVMFEICSIPGVF